LIWKITEAEKRLDELRARLEKDKENLGASYRGFKEAAEMYQRKEITASEYEAQVRANVGCNSCNIA